MGIHSNWASNRKTEDLMFTPSIGASTKMYSMYDNGDLLGHQENAE